MGQDRRGAVKDGRIDVEGVAQQFEKLLLVEVATGQVQSLDQGGIPLSQSLQRKGLFGRQGVITQYFQVIVLVL